MSENVTPYVDPVESKVEIVEPVVPNVEPVADVPDPIVEPVAPYTGDEPPAQVQKAVPAKRKTKAAADAGEAS